MKRSYISGLGFHVPDRVVTNDDLSKIMDTNDAWIVERTGIKERRHVGRQGGITTADLAVEASKKALNSAGLSAHDIDFIIFATLSPDYYFPGSGVILQDRLGCRTIGALDVRNQCSGFIYALSTAHAYIRAGIYKNILVVGAEVHSFGLDMTTRGRGVSVIFGDGAGAVILSATDEDKGILAVDMHSEGKYAEELAVLFPGTRYGWSDAINIPEKNITPEEIYPKMNGNFVFKHAITRFPETIQTVLKQAGYQMEDITLLIPHQANLRISQMVQQQLELKPKQVFNNIQKYGNTTAASIPIALCEAYEAGYIKRDDVVCLAAFGSGFTWGSVLMRW